MSSLSLAIDAVDNASLCGIKDEPYKKPNLLKIWIKSILTRQRRPLPRNLWTGRTEFTQPKVAAILRDFLQPDSKTSLESAVKSLLVLIPTNASGYAEVCSFGEMCVEIAEQIPYNHPSQLKLVQLLHYLSQSPKFIYKYHEPAKEAQGAFQLLWESIVDWASGPDEENHDAWVNFNAFQANLFATGVWGTTPGPALTVLRGAFEVKRPDEAWERDCKVMAAAQWILWNGEMICKLVIYDYLEEGEGSNWALGPEVEDSKMTPRSVERWRFWKAGFEAMENKADASEECKKVASKAAVLMGAFEQSILL